MRLYNRTKPLTEDEAIALLLNLGRLTARDLLLLDRAMSSNRPLPKPLHKMRTLILFAQVLAPTPSLH